MKHLYITLMGIVCFTTMHAQSTETFINKLWEHQTTGTPDTVDHSATTHDNLNNIIVCGNTTDGTLTNLLLSKYNSAGDSLWEITWSHPFGLSDYGTAVKTDAQNFIYVAATSITSAANGFDYVIQKFSPAGTLIWTKYYNGPGNSFDVPSDIGIDGAFVYVTGGSYGSGTDLDYCTIKMDKTTGNFIWTKRYNYLNLGDVAVALSIRSNRITITGGSASSSTNWDFFTITYDGAGTVVATRRNASLYNGYDEVKAIARDPNDNVYLTGQALNGSNYDIQTVKLDSNLNTIWTQLYSNATYNDIGNDIGVDLDGNVYVGGRIGVSGSVSKGILLKYNSSGVLIWERITTVSTNGKVLKLCLDITDSKIITANYVFNSADFDAELVAYNADGTVLWIKPFATSGNDRPVSIKLDADNYIYLTCRISGAQSIYTVVKYGETPYGSSDINDRIMMAENAFEGKVIRSDSYETSDERYIYTSHTIEITKVLKGDLDCGTVELITQGGNVNNRILDVSHALQLGPGNKGIFLCDSNKWEQSTVDFYNETNEVALYPTFEEYSFIKYWWDGTNVRVHDLKNNITNETQVYNFAERLTNTTLLDCANNQGMNNYIKPWKNINTSRATAPNYQYETYDANKNKEYKQAFELRKKNIQTETRDIQSTSVTYTMTNPIISGTTDKYFEFDVNIGADAGQYLLNAAVWLQYSTAKFGTNIASGGNLQVARGAIVSNMTEYPLLVMQDEGTGVIAIAVQAQFSPSNLSQIPGTPVKLFHVKMKIADCNASGSVSFTEQTNMLNGAWYELTPDGQGVYLYDDINATQTEVVPDCAPKILSFTPTTINGGISEVLEIRGYQFGETRGSGNVYFKNADDGGATNIALDAFDFSTGLWSDTLIKFKLPSFNDTIILPNGAPYFQPGQSLGSGDFAVINDDGQIAPSPSSLNVFYSIKNARTLNPVDKFPVKFIQKDGDVGYKFVVDTTIANHPIRLGCVVKALKDWSCETGISWELDSIPLSPVNATVQDSFNVIRFAMIDSSGGLGALTNQYYELCSSNGSDNTVCREIDLRFNNHPLIDWDYDTTGITLATNSIDFYAVLLHELGHAHSLEHVNDINAIMYWDYLPGAWIDVQRKIHLENDLSAVGGGMRILDSSLNQIYNCSGITINSMIPDYLCLMQLNTLQIESNTFNVYPNPYDDVIYVDFSSKSGENAIFSIYNLLGQEVLQLTDNNNNIGYRTLSIAAGNLPPGIYIIKSNIDGHATSRKIIRMDAD